jgi:hypothetical protein
LESDSDAPIIFDANKALTAACYQYQIKENDRQPRIERPDPSIDPIDDISDQLRYENSLFVAIKILKKTKGTFPNFLNTVCGRFMRSPVCDHKLSGLKALANLNRSF